MRACCPVPQPVVHVADVVEGGGFAGAVADLPVDGEGLLVVGEGLRPVPQPVVHEADVVQGGRFAGAVADVPVQVQGLLVTVQGFPGPPRGLQGPAQVVEGTGVRAQGQRRPRQDRDVREPRPGQPHPPHPAPDVPGNHRLPAGHRQPVHLHPPGDRCSRPAAGQMLRIPGLPAVGRWV